MGYCGGGEEGALNGNLEKGVVHMGHDVKIRNSKKRNIWESLSMVG